MKTVTTRLCYRYFAPEGNTTGRSVCLLMYCTYGAKYTLGYFLLPGFCPDGATWTVVIDALYLFPTRL